MNYPGSAQDRNRKSYWNNILVRFESHLVMGGGREFSLQGYRGKYDYRTLPQRVFRFGEQTVIGTGSG